MAGKNDPAKAMAAALDEWIRKEKLPPKALLPTVRKQLPRPGGFGVNRNLQHMAAALNLLFRQPAAEATLEMVHRANREQTFRSVFEGQSVGYWGFQSLAFTATVKCPWASEARRFEAWAQMRMGETMHACCSGPNGRVIQACGRAYAHDADLTPDPGDVDFPVIVPAADYRTRAIRGISGDGWWPPKGVGKNFWTNTDSVSARPWRADPDLPELFFKPEERAALQAWCSHRTVLPALRGLVEGVRAISQVIHVAPVGTVGHLSWAEDLHSYGAGDNTAQPLVWAHGNTPAKAVVEEPPTGAAWDGARFVVNGRPVTGFPEPGFPRIRFASAGGVITEAA